MLSLAFALAMQAAAPDPARAADGVPHIHCDQPWHATLLAAPTGEGPLRPLGLYCHSNGVGPFGPLQSPDRRRTAIIMSGQRLEVFDIAGGRTPISYGAVDEVFMGFAGLRGPPPFAWSSDSRFIWAVRQRLAGPPGGRVSTPLRPVRVYPDGHVEDLPELRHPAGGLDGLLWVGAHGLALAQFGTRGRFYEPEHVDPDPTLAIVDAGRGEVIESLPLSRLWPLTGITDRGPSIYGFLEVLPLQLPDGRIRVLLITQRDWIVWTQGEAPRRLANTPGSAVWLSVAFDGRHVLTMRPYRPERGDPEVVITGCRIPGCGPPRAPRERDWAALYDIDRGEVVWRLRRTADVSDMPWAPPAISPDGRYALIGLEPEADANRRAALVSMRDGRILQTIPATYNQHLLGFADGGRLAWFNAGTYSAVYRVR